MLKKAIEKARESQRAPWNEIRERRVLERVLSERRKPAGVLPFRGRWMIVGAVTAIAAAAVSGYMATRPQSEPPRASVPVPTRSSGHDTRTDIGESSTLALGDGSRATLEPGADVRIVDQNPSRVRIAQRRGAVTYRIERNLARTVEIEAADVIVSVIGTVFRVSVGEDGRVTVAVTEGRVRVDDGTRTLELGPTESVSVVATRAETPSAEPAASDPSAGERSEPAPTPTVNDLLRQVDAARRAGDVALAAQLLRRILTAHPRDPRIPSVLFTLGRVERTRAPERAARAFSDCVRRAPTGPLAEDALAEEAESWLAASNTVQAERAARTYLDRYPQGSHAVRMRGIVR